MKEQAVRLRRNGYHEYPFGGNYALGRTGEEGWLSRRSTRVNARHKPPDPALPHVATYWCPNEGVVGRFENARSPPAFEGLQSSQGDCPTGWVSARDSLLARLS